MNRRDALQILAGTAAIPVLPHQLRALGSVLRGSARSLAPVRVLDARQLATVGTIAELIIPTTDTPGARAAGVPEFIEVILADWLDAKDRDRFLTGLAGVDARAQALWGKPFTDGTPAQQTSLLVALDQEAAVWRGASRRDATPEPFFNSMKWLTLVGYYTSKVGAEQELHYEVVPERYNGCVPLGGA